MAKAKFVQFRAPVPQEIDFLVRAIALFKRLGKGRIFSDVLVEALTEWLQNPEHREWVESHHILEGGGIGT